MIDFHSHLDLYPDPRSVANACSARGLYVLSVTTTPAAWAGTSALAHGAPRIRTALGLHPQLAHERKSELKLFERLITETRYVGEIGLDGAPDFKRHWDDQLGVLTRILDISQAAGGRIMSIHSRRAASAILDELEKRPGAGIPILHWFSGSSRDLDRAIGIGCWFSVGPGMLQGEKGRMLASRMPIDRVLPESDGPFAQIDGRPAWPWEAASVLPVLADIWCQYPSDLEQQFFHNLARLGNGAIETMPARPER
ncbi:MAG TPA: Qat anti-phage system TatD family nuclease QatD [Bosea sp. (in: a-proteobacteria)]|uniref:Qat anti-phage system TatD family nuclease QatD n=1 Tax=Bosea sp. (in: a-proteobacteria) TaxID=1871050 RepID=UPI002E14B5D2|nr:Qat anti-phage system TatD family nuclease QatD [Bosea sp. (in: a-proteobacteria)]